MKLRALWTLFSLRAADGEFLRGLLRHENEHLRTWAIRLLTDEWPLDTVMGRRPARADTADAADAELVKEFVGLARTEKSGLVRLALASTLQRLPPENRTELAAALVGRSEDVAEENLALLVWYGLIPAADVVPLEVAKVATASQWPTTRRLIARRLAEDIEKHPAAINALLVGAAAKPVAFQADIVAGIAQALNGWRRATKPAAWETFAANATAATSASAASGVAVTPALATRLRDLSILFGDGRALDDVKALALDPKADLAARKAALHSIVEARPADLREVCERLLRVRFLNPVAARGLALFDGADVGELIATAYGTFFHPSERDVAIDVLVTRPAFARVLLSYIVVGKIPRRALTAFHARQIRSFGDPALMKQLSETWGELRDSSVERQAAIANWKKEFTPAALAAANKSAGRATFTLLCAACHTLYGEGGNLGPDLTGSGRDNLDYLLENIVDPSAVVPADYRISVVRMKDGRTLNGFIAARTEKTITVRSMTETQTVERAEIEKIEESTQSVMPEGLFDALTSEQRRDLLAYLMHPTQVPVK